MDDSNSNFPHIQIGAPLDYETFESYIARNLVRCIYVLKEFENNSDYPDPRLKAEKLVAIGNELKPVIAFLCDADISLDNDDRWEERFEEIYFSERDRRFPNDDFPMSLYYAISEMMPCEIADLLANTYSKHCAAAVNDLCIIDDRYDKQKIGNIPKSVDELLRTLSRTAIDLQKYIYEVEIRPMMHSSLMPILQADRRRVSPAKKELFVNNFHLASFGVCIANNLLIGGDLDSASVMVASESGLSLVSILGALYSRLPQIAEHLDSLVFEQQRSQLRPWPFTNSVKEWLDSKVIANRPIPGYLLNSGSVELVYLRDVKAPEQDDDKSIYIDPFNPRVTTSCDDVGGKGIEVALYRPPLVENRNLTVSYGILERDFFPLNRGMIQSVVLN